MADKRGMESSRGITVTVAIHLTSQLIHLLRTNAGYITSRKKF